MILGYGLDIMDMKRLDEKKLERLSEKVLSENEKRYFDTLTVLKRKKEFFSGRFCAREAFYKATGRGVRDFELSSIEIVKDELGKPRLIVSEEQLLFYFKRKCSVHLSLSHDGDYTIAGVIVESLG
ncbi:MAG TPA: holo-ACP synthase [Thermotogota bacterium]|nr:holo-ACP synthase [Thermotogota bacterium]